MRLYLSGYSKFNIGYTPDTLIIETKDGKHYVYDIQGDVDYDLDSLNCRVKGDLFLKVELADNYDDYLDCKTNNLYEQLLELLNDKENKVIVSIYPTPQNEENPNLNDDILTSCSGKLEVFIPRLNESKEIDFDFTTEFYGL